MAMTKKTKIKAQKKAEEDANLDDARRNVPSYSDPLSMTQLRTGRTCRREDQGRSAAPEDFSAYLLDWGLYIVVWSIVAVLLAIILGSPVLLFLSCPKSMVERTYIRQYHDPTTPEQ
jgi:hypothetical protein